MPRGAINRYPRTFAFRLTEEDGELLDDVAAAEGISAGEYARAVVSAALGIASRRRATRRGVANAKELRRLLGELGRQGNNLNQIARALNAGEATRPESSEALQAMRADHHAAMVAVLDAIGAERKP